MASGQVVKVRREKLAACMTCPLCNNLLKEATTISLCLHTFCRKCIYEKLADEEVDCCPVCDINLGCIPVDKLRPDHNLQDIRAKIFPLKRRKIEAPEIIPSIAPPAKRKERSLSSLVVSTPRVSAQGGVTGRRTRAGFRKGSATRGASPAMDETPKKEESSVEDFVEGSSSPETLNKIIQNKKQYSSAKSSNDQSGAEHLENGNIGREGKVDLWKPLNTLLEAANRSKFSKPISQGASHLKPDQTSSGDADVCMNTIKTENGLRGEVHDEKNNLLSSAGPVKRKRMRQSNKNKISGSTGPSSSQNMFNVVRRNWKDGPVWFSLVASGIQDGGEPLPQVPAAFLRVMDASMPVSSIQKYLMKKLDLATEAEVQIMCQGQPVMPNESLSTLLDLWLRTASTPKKIRTFVGDSAKEFVMVLSYSRRVASQA